MNKSFVIIGDNRVPLIQKLLKRKGCTVACCVRANVEELKLILDEHESRSGKPFDAILLVGCGFKKKDIKPLLDEDSGIELVSFSKGSSIKEFLESEVVNT